MSLPDWNLEWLIFCTVTVAGLSLEVKRYIDYLPNFMLSWRQRAEYDVRSVLSDSNRSCTGRRK